MPKFPQYNVPTFPPTGNAEVDAALDEWRTGMGEGYAQNLFESEKLPYIESTFVTFNKTSGEYISKTLQLRGTETVLVTGNLQMFVPGGSTMLGHFRIIYPNGTTETFTGYPITFGTPSLDVFTTVTLNVETSHVGTDTAVPHNSQLNGSVQSTVRYTTRFKATVSGQWAPELRQQQSGVHSFQLVLTSGSGGSVTQGNITILVT